MITPHPSLLLMLKILTLIEAERDKELGYRDAIQVLEAAAILLRSPGPNDFATTIDSDPTFDLTPWLKTGLDAGK